MHRLSWKVLTLAAIVSLAFVGTALAAHGPVGTSVVNGTSDPQARGTLVERVHFKLGRTKIHIKEPVDVITQEVRFAGTNPGPAGNAGWHSHPGAVFVVIRTGTLTVWDEHCVRNEYSPGETFFEAGPHHPMLVKNEGAADATLYVTYIVPVGTTVLRITEPDRCGVL